MPIWGLTLSHNLQNFDIVMRPDLHLFSAFCHVMALVVDWKETGCFWNWTLDCMRSGFVIHHAKCFSILEFRFFFSNEISCQRH